MRLLVILLTIVLVINILGFVLTNLDTKVSVTIWKSEHPDVSLFLVVLLSVVAGIVYASLIAVAEGANIRLENRRLRREIQKLETELNYLRTQPPTRPGVEPDALQEAEGKGAAGEAPEAGGAPASAPVYGPDDAWRPDPDDDSYSGGRAV